MRGGHDVEQLVITGTVKDCLAIARAFDGDGLCRGAFENGALNGST